MASNVRKKIRVCTLIGDLLFGGGENRILNLARNIDRERFDYSVCTINALDIEKEGRYGSLRNEFLEAGIKLESLGQPHNKTRANSLLPLDVLAGARVWIQLANQLKQLIRERDIDIIDAHLGVACLVAPLACCRTNAKSVLTQYNLKIWKTWTKFLPGQLSLGLSDALVTDSKVKCDEMIKWAIRPPSRTAIIPNGVLPPVPSLTSSEALELVGIPDRPDNLVVGQISRLVRFKGHTTLISAAKKVIESCPNVYFILAGYSRDESGYLNELKELAASLGIGDRIKFVSYAGPIGDLWQLIDVHVHASWFDSLPNAIIEAMSLRKPSVVTAVGGVPDLLTNEVSGLVVPPKNENALASSLVRVLKDSSLGKEIGQAAYEKYLKECQPEIMANRLESLFEELCR